jgi:hypothetical protein
VRHTAYLLLGLLGLVLVGASCGGGGGGGASCRANQYFVVEWEVDDSVTSFTCASTPPSHVEVTTSGGEILDVANVTCDDREQYNWIGATVADIPVNTTIIGADLYDDISGALLSTLDVPVGLQVGVPPCNYAMYSFQFPIQ